jgi:hypothetical protein
VARALELDVTPRSRPHGNPAARSGFSAHNVIMTTKARARGPVRAIEPELDEMTRRRREALAAMEKLPLAEIFKIAVRTGIYTEDGQLTPPYRPDAEPSASRPSD